MTRQKENPTLDAIKTLLAAGKRSDVRALLAKEDEDAARAYKAIEGNDTLSDIGRRRQLASSYLGRRDRVERELQRLADTCAQQDRSDASSVLGVYGLKGDPASLAISMRDATDRVAEINNAGELNDLLRRADRTGDEVLARAIAARALDIQEPAPLHQFLATRPQLDSAVERLWNANRADTESFDLEMQLAALRPAELLGASLHELERAAEATEPQPAQPTEPTANPYSFTYNSGPIG